MTGHLKLLLSGVVLLFCSVLIAGCGSSSSSSDTDSDTTTTETTTVAVDANTCGTSGSLYNGCYSASSDSSAKWNGACLLESVAAGNYVYLYFKASKKCNFTWVRAQGDVGESWRKLGSDALVNTTSDEFVIQHTAENVHMIRWCANGVDDTNDVRNCI